MGLSSAAARCGLYTASRTGFSSNRQLSVLPALNAYKPTLHVLFFCFVFHYSSAACNIQFIFQENLSWPAHLSNNRMHALRAFYCHEKKNVPWHILVPRRGCFSNHLPLRRVRILAEHFYRMENEVSYTIKKGRICFPIRPFQIEFYFLPIPLTLRTGCYTALHKSRSVQAASRGCPAR